MNSLVLSLAFAFLFSTTSVLAQSDMVPMPACLVNHHLPSSHLHTRPSECVLTTTSTDNLPPHSSPRFRLQLLHAELRRGRRGLYTGDVRAEGPDL